MTDPDYYARLGVSENSDDAAIQAAYRALMRKYHPDINQAPDATLRCVEINRAYEVLADPIARAEYDTSRVPVIRVNAPPTPSTRTPAVWNAQPKRAPLREQDPMAYLFCSAISVAVMTALVRLAVSLLPHPVHHYTSVHRCRPGAVAGVAPRSDESRDCPIIAIIDAPPIREVSSAPAKP